MRSSQVLERINLQTITGFLREETFIVELLRTMIPFKLWNVQFCIRSRTIHQFL